MMRTSAALVLLLVAAGLFAISAKVVDTDGPASVKLKAGKTEAVRIGKVYATGDSIRTGKDGLVELSQEGLTIRVGPSTVFTLMEKDVGGKAKGVLAVTLGSIKVKYDRLTGSEPLLQSVGCNAGVRGTELSIVAGPEGSSLIAVESGKVAVEAFGKTVELGPGEAVEVANGQAPGDKFTVQRDQVDYRAWGEERLESLLSDPLAALAGMRERLAYYAENVSAYHGRFIDVNARLEAERERVVKIGEEKGKDAQQAYHREHVLPLQIESASLVLNYRHFGLSALSMRRFVGGRMYLLLKAKFAATPEDPAWVQFLEGHEAFVAAFEETIMPVLKDDDF